MDEEIKKMMKKVEDFEKHVRELIREELSRLHDWRINATVHGGLKIKAGSIWLVVAVLVSIGVTLLSTLYPVRFASKLVTLSLERK